MTKEKAAPAPSADRARWRSLPARIYPEDYVTEQPSESPHDPDGERDPERDWMLRYSA